MLWHLLVAFFLALFTKPTQAEAEPEEIVPDPHGSIVPAGPSRANGAALVGTLWLELLDLRQLVTTLQTQYLANLQAENDTKTVVPGTEYTAWLQLELVNDARQGQVCKATIDLKTGAFTVRPASLTFRVTNPQTKLAISVYTQSLDVVYQAHPSTALATARSSRQQHQQHQSVGGKLRSIINPINAAHTIGSGLESGFDSFLHVFDPNSKPSNASAAALAEAAGPHPVVLMGRAELSVCEELAAPTQEHSQVAWVTLSDEEGLQGPSIASVDQLLLAHAKRRQQKKREHLDHHPLLLTQPMPTFSMLVHSYYRTTEIAHFRGQVARANHIAAPPSATTALEASYTILFRLADGSFDLVRVSAQHRAAALAAYEKLQVGLTPEEAAKARATSAPVLVGKLLLSPQNHVLQARFFDLTHKRELLSYARRFIRPELAESLLSVDSDVLQPRRALAPSSGVPTPASASTATVNAVLDPHSSFAPFLFVSSYHSLFSNLNGVLHLVVAVGRLLTWSDVYASFFFWLAFIFVCFHPSFLAALFAALLIIALARKAARMHFEDYLRHHGHMHEYEKNVRTEKEDFIGLVWSLHEESSRGASPRVLQFLYLVQCVCCFFTVRTLRFASLVEWRDEPRTLSLIVFLAYTLVVALVAPLELLLLFFLASLALHRTHAFQVWLRIQAMALTFRKQRYSRSLRVQFPPSAVALKTMADRLRK